MEKCDISNCVKKNYRRNTNKIDALENPAYSNIITIAK